MLVPEGVEGVMVELEREPELAVGDVVDEIGTDSVGWWF